jgi:hypothetical protein
MPLADYYSQLADFLLSGWRIRGSTAGWALTSHWQEKSRHYFKKGKSQNSILNGRDPDPDINQRSGPDPGTIQNE